MFACTNGDAFDFLGFNNRRYVVAQMMVLLTDLCRVPCSWSASPKTLQVEEGGEKKEYRAWNPYRSKLAAAVVGGIDNCQVAPGKKVLYLGVACKLAASPQTLFPFSCSTARSLS